MHYRCQIATCLSCRNPPILPPVGGLVDRRHLLLPGNTTTRRFITPTSKCLTSRRPRVTAMILSKTLPRSLVLILMLYRRWCSDCLECVKNFIFIVLFLQFSWPYPNHSWNIMNFRNLFFSSWLLSWFINITSHNSVQAPRSSCLMFLFSFLIPVRRCHGRFSFPFACHVIHARSLAMSFCCHTSSTLSDWLLCKFSKNSSSSYSWRPILKIVQLRNKPLFFLYTLVLIILLLL